MSGTHIAVGVAAALAVVQPHAPVDVAAAVLAGAAGGMLPDIDTRNSASRRDACRGGLVLAALAALLVLADWRFDAGLVDLLVAGAGPVRVAGFAVLAFLLVWGVLSKHRTFTHSLLGLALYGAAVCATCAPLTAGFVAGMASHVALDLLNYKPVGLLYPMKRGLCLGLYRADGWANNVLFAAGCVASVALVVVLLL